MSTLTPNAKNHLSGTICALRKRLLKDIHDAAEGQYRLSVAIEKAGLSEARRIRRKRLDDWLDERARTTNPKNKKQHEAAVERFRLEAEKEAAYTLLNRLVAIRHMEAMGMLKPAVITGGWQSPGYKEFREFSPAFAAGDDTEGYAFLLHLLYQELAVDLPGLFGDVGVTSLFPVQASTLREVIERLNDPRLDCAWTDDTTLGWVYQFWNDTERKALDDKIANRGKIEGHEIAPKTQLFTERYMVEWLLQNSLNNQWLAICKKNGWRPEAEATGLLDALEARREQWREKRDAGEVTPEEIMPINGSEEHRWKYWVKQELPEEMIQAAPSTIRDLKILDPAVGSGHFLVIAFDLLAAFYEEEARHRGEPWSTRQIAESILENNLHGVDLDPRAVQIAATALWLKAYAYCPEASPRTINLVASNLGLSALPDDDPALVELKKAVKAETGIPEALTDKIIQALKGADHLGSLLKIDETVDKAIRQHEQNASFTRSERSQGDLFKGYKPTQTVISFDQARLSVIELLDKFLTEQTQEENLGLRLRGEQLAAGVRFIRMVQAGKYDLVVANPPYLGGAKMAEKKYIVEKYEEGKADLYAVFLQRGIELAKQFGLSAMVTMRGWMFINDYKDLRLFINEQKSIYEIADLHFGAFPEMKDVSVSMSIMMNAPRDAHNTAFVQPVKRNLVVRDLTQILRNVSGLIAPYQRFDRPVRVFEVIQGQPLIYWWDDDFLKRYAETPKLEEESPVRQGLASSNNTRFLRLPWEIKYQNLFVCRQPSMDKIDLFSIRWVPYVKGSAGKAWLEPISEIINWSRHGLEVKVYAQALYGSYTRTIKNEKFYFNPGVAFTSTGSVFSARVHGYRSVFDVKGQSVFVNDPANTVCLMNSRIAKEILVALNPTISFQVGDAKRLPLFELESSEDIFQRVRDVFFSCESAREVSIEFKQPGSSTWQSIQDWAQQAIDRPKGLALPEYAPVCVASPPTDYVSFAVGIVLGRFGANGEGILTEAPSTALPRGILFLSDYSGRDSLTHAAAKPILDDWDTHGGEIAPGKDAREWLRLSFFKDVHLGMYEKRPIYFPLSSAKKNFVAYVSIHRWSSNTLQTLLADHLIPERRSIEGELEDLQKARAKREATRAMENRYASVQQLYEELVDFINAVSQIAEKGPPQPDDRTTPREKDARFEMDLDDGVMINSAALWPLLEPQWKDPKKWWNELANAQGRKDYDWAHLAKRYFPSRVEEKCKQDPSMGVAHGCFWKYHPAVAYKWELRLQDEIAPDFNIDEEDSDEHRARFLEEHPDEAKEILEKEMRRRELKSRGENDEDSAGPLFDASEGEDENTEENDE